MFELEEVGKLNAKIKVIGVGGGGGNAINNMIAANLFGVEFIAVNTDCQHLDVSLSPIKIQIGRTGLTKGLGAGSNPSIGRQAALEDKEPLSDCIKGADMIFITAGMGGGTGTGAAPVIANLAKDLGILAVSVVTKPFYYEGRKRALNAEEGVRELKKHVDALIVIPNDRIHLVVEKGTSLLKSFSIANDVLRQAVQGITDLILIPGLINLDFADVRSVMGNAGRSVIGMGIGNGERGAVEAAKKAISNPLLEESSIEGAKAVLINVTGGLNMSIDVVQEAASLIYESVHDEANIILGAVVAPDMEEDVRVTVIATGLKDSDMVERDELFQSKKWTPMKYSRKSEGSERILSKSIDIFSKEGGKGLDNTQDNFSSEGSPESQYEEQEHNPALNKSILPVEDIHDIPTFLRRQKAD
ncbi:cell division protein FtsZ [Thermodesulfovibrionales bacterium]|nr:cell division protein FtsZ [Thermodesulfovibrionales bacterium]